MLDLSVLLEPVMEIAKTAGAKIAYLYQEMDELDITIKENKTPQIEADRVAHQVIKQGLKILTPNIPLLSEEEADIPFATRSTWETYWLVDPLDGTKEFIHRTDEFTVNIALIDHHKPILGVIYIPIFDLFYFASAGQGAFKQEDDQALIPIHTRKNFLPETELVVVVSRRHGKDSLESFIKQIHPHKIIQKGSSLKSCLIAEGKADIYPCLGPTSEWDMAAAQCIVEEAGGCVIDRNFQPLRYNTQPSLKNPQLIIVGNPDYNWRQYWQSNPNL